ncbi:hypothetical protein MSZK_43800 [Mycobacterium sp. shizuoka-1]|nr:hypothetical protein MSZK_43800 [Mycobacterium sp. shizuoka-1]
MWPHPEFEDSAERGPVLAAGGEASRGDPVKRYSERTERDASAITWYLVLAGFKHGIIAAATHARAGAGKASRHAGDRFHRSARSVFEPAHELRLMPSRCFE